MAFNVSRFVQWLICACLPTGMACLPIGKDP
jgi:hypothetical protein